MTDHPTHHDARPPANPVLFSLVMIINFVVIAGIIFTNTALPQADPEAPAVASLATATTAPTQTPPPPAASFPPTEAPVESISVAGDPLNGRILFNTFQPAASFACATCHLADREDRLIGPGLLNVSIRAESRVPGMSVNDYLHTSIVSPGAFVVPEFPDGLMPANWADIYSEGEIGDLVAYLMTLR